MSESKAVGCSLFQFTPLCERLPIICLSNKGSRSFQFTPLCERLLALNHSFALLTTFQFTPLCERLLLARARNFHRSHYFNSRLSARGYGSGSGIQATHFISIHASLREATRKQIQADAQKCISIHASLREATAKTDNI